MRILIDTNVILDLILNRCPHSDNALSIISSCIKHEHIGYVSSHSLSDLFYILRKDKSVEERKVIILNICKYFNVLAEDKNFYETVCLNPKYNDIEDGLQMLCAESEALDYIVTRNISDFTDSAVQAITPEKFIAMMR